MSNAYVYNLPIWEHYSLWKKQELSVCKLCHVIHAHWLCHPHHMLLCYCWPIFATGICLPIPTQRWLGPVNPSGSSTTCTDWGSHTSPSRLSQALSVVDVTHDVSTTKHWSVDLSEPGLVINKATYEGELTWLCEPVIEDGQQLLLSQTTSIFTTSASCVTCDIIT